MTDSRSSPSPLLQIWPEALLLLTRHGSGDVRADIDRLLSNLLPAARVNAASGKKTGHLGAVIRNNGRLKFVRSGFGAVWSDMDALADRLDALVAASKVRAVGQSDRVTLRRSDGLHNWTTEAIHIRVDHREPASYDFLVPLDWAPIRRPDVPDPTWRDRIASRYPRRAWPSAPAEVLSAAEAYERYLSEGVYDELIRAIEISRDDLRRSDGSRRSVAADQLAGYLGAHFLHTGEDSDLEAAVTVARQAAENSWHDAVLQARLGRLLGLRFLRDGRLSSLEQGIDEVRHAARRASAEVPTEIVEIFGELLMVRYRATAERESLTEALEMLMSTTEQLRADDSEVPARLAALCGDAYLQHFEQSNDRDALDIAVTAFHHSVQTTGENSEFPRRLRGYGEALLRLYESTQEDNQLELAYRALALALINTHDNSPERPWLQISLAAARVYRLPDERLVALLEEELEQQGATPEVIASLKESFAPPWFIFLGRNMQMLIDLVDHLPKGTMGRSAALAELAKLRLDWFARSGSVDVLREAASAAVEATEDWSARFAAVAVEQKLGTSQEGTRLFELAVRTLLELGEKDLPAQAEAHGLAFVLAEAAKSRLLTEQLGRGEIAASPEVPAALAQRERALVEELSALDAAALAARDAGVEFRPSRERREQLVADLNDVWAEMNAPDYVAMRRGDTLDLLNIRDVVTGGNSNTGVLSLFVLDNETALFFAGADGAGFGVARVPVGTARWDGALRRFQRELPSSFGQDVVPPTWEAPLGPLVQTAAAHLDGCSHLLVVPHGPAHALPWSYLMRNWEVPPAVSIVPSLGTLDRIRRRSAPRSQHSVVIGNPTGDLADAETEANAVGRVLKVTPLLGLEASTAALDSAASTARTLHLACHAGFDPDSPLDSHVVLWDGRWRARDALNCRLDAELVVLSGCETGLAGRLAGDELAGLAQAFLYAGARSVVVSLWRISDAAGAELMRLFHERHAGGASKSAALHGAADAVRCERDHPWYWAAFTLVGDS